MMKNLRISEVKKVLLMSVGVVTVSHFVIQLFGHTIPSIIEAFVKDFGAAIILSSVFLFAFIWLLKARPHNRPKHYSVIVFDIFGKEAKLDGIRTEFKTHDVAWSFMKQYKRLYPLYNFAMVSSLPKSERRVIFRYI
jgi:hypothetical protein